MHTRTAAALLLVATACATAKRGPPPLPPLGADGEVHVLALPLAREAERLTFTVDAVSLVRSDGSEVPMQVEPGEVVGSDAPGQRRLATARVPPGEYTGFAVRVGSAMLVHDDTRSRLLVKPEPARAELSFRVAAGSATVAWVSLDAARSIQGDYGFAPVLTATLAPQTPPQVALYVTNTGGASVTAVDRGTRLVTGVIPVGAEPRGIALDRLASRAWVALSREDQLEILDVAANRAIGRIRLTPGDGPGELALTPDGAVLLSANVRSRTVSFVDPAAMSELERAPVGDDPVSLVVDRSGRRAYVANRASASITVLDVPHRAVVATLPTDPEPLWLDLNRDGTRLYVVHRGSGYLDVFALPSLALESRAFVGLGATAIKVDPRTDLIYLSRGLERRIQVFEPVSLQPLDAFEVPGAVSRMTIDDTQNALVALVPERRALAVIDLTSRKLVAELPVGADPFDVVLAGER